jgi:chromosome segregation ATPase
MDPELIAYLDKRFDEVNKQIRANGVEIEGLRGAVRANSVEIEGLRGAIHANGVEIEGLRGAIRGNGVEIEGLRVDIKQVAEGVAATNQRIDAFEVQVNARFDEMGKMLHASHSNLHGRVSSLEAWREKIDPSPSVARKRRT